MSKVGVAECLLDCGDLLQSVVKSVIAELLVFNFLEGFAYFFHHVREESAFFDAWKTTISSARGMILIHEDETFQGLRQRFRVAGSNRTQAREAKNIIGDFAPPVVLGNKDIDELGGGAAFLEDGKKDIGLLELSSW